MAYFFQEPSHTFSEYLLVPGYSSEHCIPANVSLKTPVVRFKKGEECPLTMNVPMVSAVMQAVSGEQMGIALAKEGGIAFIYVSQSIESQAAMVRRVKNYKAGFVISDSNLRVTDTLADVLALKQRTGHSTMAVTDDGTGTGKMLGLVTSRDYRVSRMDPDAKVADFMTPVEKLIYAPEGTSLKTANDIIWDHKLNALPIISEDGHLVSFVFRKDYDSHKGNPLELLDSQKRYVVGAGINTRDYEERVPALVEAGVDVLVMDSSEGYSYWQKHCLEWIRAKYGDTVKVGAGNVVDGEGFRFLADAGAVRPRASAAVRPPQSSTWPPSGISILRRPASMCPSAPTAASCRTITSRWRWPWALTSACWAGISPGLTSLPPARSLWAAAI